MVHLVPRKRLAYFLPRELANGETNVPLFTAVATLLLPPQLLRPKRNLKAKLSQKQTPAVAAGRKGKKCHLKEYEEVHEYDPAYGRNIGPDRWIADTGRGDDLIGHSDMTPQERQGVEPAPESLCFKSANGPRMRV